MIWMELLGGLVRWLMTLIGAALVERHILNAPQAEALTDDVLKHVLMAVPLVLPLVWSLVQKWRGRWKWDDVLQGHELW